MSRVKLTQSGRDVALGYDNLYSLQTDDSGDWEIIESSSRTHNFSDRLCDFHLVKNVKNDKIMLIGSSANSSNWVGRKITIEKYNKMSILDLAEYLEA